MNNCAVKTSLVRAFRSVSVFCAVVAMLCLSSVSFSISLHAQSIFTDDKGHAVKGYDPVAYFTEKKPMQGKLEFVHEWNGAKWLFVTAEHRDMFKAAPEKYAPQYGGFCAFGVCMKNAKYPIDPTAWKIVDGKLYLNYNQGAQAAWEKDPMSETIAKGDKNWKMLATAKK